MRPFFYNLPANKFVSVVLLNKTRIISPHYSQTIIWLVKALLLISIAWLIYDQIIARHNIDNLIATYKASKHDNHLGYLILCILLMPLNWLVESIKWRSLVLPWKSISLLQSIKAIMGGIAVGIVTPARLGEYAGRYALLPGADKQKSIPATLVSSISQNIINVIAGYLGALVFCFLYFPINRFTYLALSVIGLVGIFLILILFYRMSSIDLSMLSRYRWGKILLKQANVLTYYHSGLLHYTLSLSALRYLIYSIQYVMILYYFGIDISFIAALSGVSVIFLLQSGVPLPPMLSVVARGELAIVVWSLFTDNVAGILVATFCLWIINLVLPALLGLLIVLNVNLTKSSHHDEH